MPHKSTNSTVNEEVKTKKQFFLYFKPSNWPLVCYLAVVRVLFKTSVSSGTCTSPFFVIAS